MLASQVENECFETRFSDLARGLFLSQTKRPPADRARSSSPVRKSKDLHGLLEPKRFFVCPNAFCDASIPSTRIFSLFNELSVRLQLVRSDHDWFDASQMPHGTPSLFTLNVLALSSH